MFGLNLERIYFVPAKPMRNWFHIFRSIIFNITIPYIGTYANSYVCL